MKNLFNLLIILNVVSCHIQGQEVHKWDFDSKTPFTSTAGKLLDNISYRCDVKTGSDGGNFFLFNNGKECLIPFNLFHNGQVEFSFSFNFKGSYFSYISFPVQNLKLIFDYDFIQFSTAISSNSQYYSDHWVIKLDGINAPNYADLSDGNWHNIIFKGNTKKGIKEVIIDGIKYSHSFENKDKKNFSFPPNDGFRKIWDIDDIEFYDRFISDKKCNEILLEASNKVKSKVSKNDSRSGRIDSVEYAPGYPSYTMDLLTQLSQFPLARFVPGIEIQRNFSWLDINYLHRRYIYPRKDKFGSSNPQYAVSIEKEMADYWNYYVDIPTLRIAPEAAEKIYSDTKSIPGSIIYFSNSRPDLPSSTIMIHSQINPTHFGFNSNKPFILSQDLPINYYLKSNSRVIIYKGKKWLSPLMPIDIIVKDGKTAGLYIKKVNNYLKRPIDYINENGEIYGHKRPLSLFEEDFQVAQLIKKLKLNVDDFNGWFQNKLDSTYKFHLLKESGNAFSKFSFYDLSASANEYWPSYKMRMQLNSEFNGRLRSTPSFYPRTPGNWVFGQGAYAGYGVIAEGRKREIQLGVNRFAPFVSPGWGAEENNIRPAQWLSLLKAMFMLGADFFHVAYFNITNSLGGWENGIGPNNPAGYAYQIAMPTYTQGLLPYASSFLDNGILLKGDYTVRGKDFRFQGLSENHLVLVRKEGSKYLIYGSIQKNTNNINSIPDSAVTEINLEGKSIRFYIRPQGSVYILNFKDSTFIQLDKWHQKEHPIFWDKTIVLEAELSSGAKGKIRTENLSENSFLDVISYSRLSKPESKLTFYLPIRNTGNYDIIVRARSGMGKAKINYTVNRNGRLRSYILTSNAWKEYLIESSCILQKVNNLKDELCQITIESPDLIDIDYLKIIPINK